MTQRLRILLTATTLAALSVLSPAVAAHATPPQHDPASQDRVSVCNSGHGSQYDCPTSAPGGQPTPGPTASAPAASQPAAIISIAAVLGLVVALSTGGIRYRLRHRPREPIGAHRPHRLRGCRTHPAAPQHVPHGPRPVEADAVAPLALGLPGRGEPSSDQGGDQLSGFVQTTDVSVTAYPARSYRRSAPVALPVSTVSTDRS
jgi:hypothetical protein